MFFFEKKNQKTFARRYRANWTMSAPSGRSVGAKVFCFFFSKKKTCLLPVKNAAPHNRLQQDFVS
jgi:hypothetical protein